MKTAKAQIDTFSLSCPNCDGYLICPDDGSLTWLINGAYPNKAPCADCGEVSRLPKRIPGDKIAIDRGDGSKIDTPPAGSEK